ncbi:MAG TPA: uroporphyrinogen-III synthase [Stellaceae bacterium]
MTATPARFGFRALVTRPRAEAEGLARALAERGIEAIVEPLLDIHYRDGPAPDLAGVQAILCTSANGVRALARLSPERELPVFAVGEATAARARAERFTRVESADGNVEDLARLVGDRLRPESGRLCHAAGSDVAGDLAGMLRDHGFAVDRTVLYEARPAVALSAAAVRALGAGIVDFVLLFSPRTAAIFLSLAERAELADVLRTVTAVSISTAADAALGGAIFRERRIAEAPTQAALLSTLDHIFAKRRHA